jgi:hypothetical protein
MPSGRAATAPNPGGIRGELTQDFAHAEPSAFRSNTNSTALQVI